MAKRRTKRGWQDATPMPMGRVVQGIATKARRAGIGEAWVQAIVLQLRGSSKLEVGKVRLLVVRPQARVLRICVHDGGCDSIARRSPQSRYESHVTAIIRLQ